jgi:gas vesicle protein
MNTTMKVIGGFLAGAALGTVAGILIAPDKGSKTRRKIQDESKKLSDQVVETVSHSLKAFKDDYNDSIDKYAEKGKSSIDTVKDKMKA